MVGTKYHRRPCFRCHTNSVHASAACSRPQLRCQLVCKAWRHALDARRWPLWGLGWHVPDAASEVPPAALWAQRLRPAVRCLSFELGGTDGIVQWAWRYRQDSDDEYSEDEDEPLPFDSAAVQAVHAALLALQPSVSAA